MTEDAARPKVEFFNPPTLAEKVPTLSGPDPKDAMRRAESAMANIASQFKSLLQEELDALDALMADYRTTSNEENLDRLFRRIHNLRGQGTTMGFPLLSRIGSSFCGYLIDKEPEKPVNKMLIEQHLQALHIVLESRMANEGDAVARDVADALEQAVRKELS